MTNPSIFRRNISTAAGVLAATCSIFLHASIPALSNEVSYLDGAALGRMKSHFDRRRFESRIRKTADDFATHPLSKYFDVPRELDNFIANNAAQLDRMADQLNSVDRVPKDTFIESLAKWCERGTLENPIAIVQEIAGARAPRSCGGCDPNKIELAMPLPGSCRKSFLGTQVYREYTEEEALEMLDRSLNATFEVPKTYKIGSVQIDTRGRAEKEFELIQELQDAQSAYDVAREIRDLRISELEEAQTINAGEVAGLRRPVRALEAEIKRMREAGLKDPEVVQKSNAYRRFTRQIENATRRSDQIDAAIKNLFENYPANDQFAKDRIRALQTEQEQVFERKEAARQSRNDLSMPERTEKEITDIRALEDNLFVLKNDAERRIRLADSKLDSRLNLLDAAEDALTPLEARLSKALKASRDFKQLSGKLIASLTTDHAKFENTGPIPDLLPLNQLIQLLSERERSERREFDKAQREFREAAGTAEERQLELRNAGYRSIFKQIGVEIGFSAYDLLDAYKRGKVHGVAAEAWTQFTLNLVFGVSYADAQEGTLEQFKKMRASTDRSNGDKFDDLTKWAKLTGQQLGKHFLSLPKETQISYLESLRGVEAAKRSHKSVMKAIHESVSRTGFADINKLMQPYYTSLAEQEKLAKRYADLIGSNGFRASAKASAKGFMGGLAKEVVKELAKQEVAELTEQPAFNRYMNAQVDLSIAFGKKRWLGAKHANTKGMLETHRALRDQILARYDGLDPQTGWQEVKNDAWFAAANYAFWLDLTEEGKERVRDLEIDMELEGIELIRDQSTTYIGWRIPKGISELLYNRLPDELSVVIKIK